MSFLDTSLSVVCLLLSGVQTSLPGSPHSMTEAGAAAGAAEPDPRLIVAERQYQQGIQAIRVSRRAWREVMHMTPSAALFQGSSRSAAGQRLLMA